MFNRDLLSSEHNSSTYDETRDILESCLLVRGWTSEIALPFLTVPLVVSATTGVELKLNSNNLGLWASF